MQNHFPLYSINGLLEMIKHDALLQACLLCSSRNIYLYHTDCAGRFIYICGDCLVQFLNPQYSDEYLSEYYSKYTAEEPEWDEPLSYGHNYYLSLIEKFYPKKGRILDIGCGKGHLLCEAQKRGWAPLGYDVDPAAAAYFGKKLGIEIITGNFTAIDWADRTFDAVSLHHAFEHLKNPAAYLDVIDTILVKSGILFLALPNISGLSSKLKFFLEKMEIRIKNVGKYYDAAHHLFYYEPKTITLLLVKRGYKILLVRSGHRVRANQTTMMRLLNRSILERIPWHSTFLVVAVKG